MATQGLTKREASKQLGVGVRTVERYIRKGLLEAKKIDGRVYIAEDSLRHVEGLKGDRLDRKKGDIDPLRHVVIDRSEWRGIMDRLSQLQAKETVLLESERMMKERMEAFAEKEQDLARLQERSKWLEIELHNLTRPWWQKVLGVGKRRVRS